MCCNFDSHEFIVRAPNEKKLIEDFLRAQIDLMNSEWDATSTEAIKSALNAYKQQSDSQKGIEKFLAVLLLKLKNVISKTKLKEFNILTEGLYDSFKTSAAKKFKTELIFEEFDKKLLSVFGQDGPYWINNFYNTFLSDRIKELSQKLLEKGLDNQEIGKRLGEMIEKELALKGGSNYKTLVPKRFAGNIESYNEIIASTAAQRLKTFAAIRTLYQGGFEVFVYTATMDKRTCSRCVELHGQKFAVQLAHNKLEAIVDSDSPEEFKAIMPWYNDLKEVQALTQNQVPIPPIHGRCRCTIESA